MWRFEYRTLANLRTALAAERTRVETELAVKRAFTGFRAVGPSLYIVYLRDVAPAGPFPISAPYEWPRTDRDSLQAVMEVAFSTPTATTLYAHYRLSARDAAGEFLSPAGRVDLLVGRRIATALPEDHPARHRPPNLETVDPILFYEDPEPAS
jgi:hypothetical protein